MSHDPAIEARANITLSFQDWLFTQAPTGRALG